MKSLRFHLFLFAFGLAACGVMYAQSETSEPANQTAAPGPASPMRLDQDRDKSSRVAAPAEQIRTVLVRDPGLLVELERLVEREAISKGQLVEDSDLTQQAIFDRLDDDTAFRAAATRLVQRYGYLRPTVNPDSEIGKEQEFLLKERARKLVQIETQEDNEALTPKNNGEEKHVSSNPADCDPRNHTNCTNPAPKRSRTSSSSPLPNEQQSIQEFAPERNSIPRSNTSPLTQTKFSTDGLTTTLDSDGTSRSAVMNAMRDAYSAQPASPETQGYLGAARSVSGIPDDLFPRMDPFSPTTNGSNSSPSWQPSRIVRGLYPSSSGDSPQGTLVRKASPYSDIPSLVDLYVQVASHNRAAERFGVDILTSGARDSGAISMDMPAGPDYVVGPGDGLSIDLWGSVSQRLQRTVDHEGRIYLPEYGPLLVSGKTLGDVQLAVQQLLRTQLRDVSTDVSLSRLRTIRVYVVGEVVEPGAYDVSSLSSPLNALVAAGGLTKQGSLRAIKHYRGQQLLEVVDAYDLLLRGVGPNQSRLENGDSLLIPLVGPQVTIEGMVRRPAIYELRGNTSLEEALELAGGVLPAATLKHVEVERLVAHENRTMLSLDLSEDAKGDGASAQIRIFQVHDGDRIHIFPIAPYNQQAIYLQGHVLRPGRYSYKEGMTVRDLVGSYADLLPEPAGKYAEIIRLNPPDYRPSVESFDLAASLETPVNAPQLKPLDTIRIFSKYDFEPVPEIRIDGEVRIPGLYTTAGQARFRDAIFVAGGLTADASLDSAQIFRSGKNGSLTILNVNLNEAISGNPSQNLLLQPRDRIVVHRNALNVELPAVYIKGDVTNPGRYPLAYNMSVQDLVRAAGGLKPSANSQSALLAHHQETSGTPELRTVEINLAVGTSDHSDRTTQLANGDVLTIRKNPSWNDLGTSVTIRGEVEHPGTYGIRPGESLSSILAKAGGFTSQAYSYGTVLTRKEVRDLEMQSHQELVARMKAEQVQLKALPETDTDQKNVKLTAIAQTETALTQLETHLPVGRVVLNGTLDEKSFDRTAGQTPLRNGDVILVPKKPNYVMVQGQVFNGTAVGYVPGRSGNWYLGQAGGYTQLADKKAAFVIRADGSVLAAKNNRTVWSGDPLDAVLMPGDVIVVPEKAPKIGNRNWMPLLQTAQVATSVALAVAYLKP
ncbi:MAG TPA: SLBB domain-containing protein [Candidatus Acidoferrum sp.]|nr:SLBB domain-containing protein [Candidatus Acidoferrum sp.]